MLPSINLPSETSQSCRQAFPVAIHEWSSLSEGGRDVGGLWGCMMEHEVEVDRVLRTLIELGSAKGGDTNRERG